MKSPFRFLIVLSFLTISFSSWTYTAEEPLELPEDPIGLAKPAGPVEPPDKLPMADELAVPAKLQEPPEKVIQKEAVPTKVSEIPEPPAITESTEKIQEPAKQEVEAVETAKPVIKEEVAPVEEVEEIEPLEDFEDFEDFEEEAPLEEIEEPTVEPEAMPTETPSIDAPTAPTRQLTLEEEQTPLMRGVSESRQQWFAQATKYTTKIEALIQDINKKTSSLHETQRTLDEQLDAFYNKANPNLGSLQKTSQDFQRTLDQKHALNQEASKLKITLNTLRKNIKQAQLDIEEVATLERTLIEQLSLIDSQRDNATKSATQANKTKQQILSEQSEEAAKEHFTKIIELYGGIVQATSYITDLKETSVKQAEEITQHIQTISEKVEQLQEHATELKEQLTTIEIEEDEPTDIEEDALPVVNNLQIKKTKQMKITPLNWYEKSIAASAIFVLTIRDFFRDIFGTTPAEKPAQTLTTQQAFSLTRTSTFEQQIDIHIKKLVDQKQAAEQAKIRWQQIEQEKASLLGQLNQKNIKISIPTTQKPLPQESVGQLVRRIFFATIALIKKVTNPVRVFVINILIKAGIMQEPIEVKALVPTEAELGAIEPQVEPEGIEVPIEEEPKEVLEEESLELEAEEDLELEPEEELELEEK